jgi:hypothetical protein
MLVLEFFLLKKLKIKDLFRIFWSGKYIFILSFLLMSSLQLLHNYSSKTLKFQYIYDKDTLSELKPNNINISFLEKITAIALKKTLNIVPNSVKWGNEFVSIELSKENKSVVMKNKNLLINISHNHLDDLDKNIGKIQKILNRNLLTLQSGISKTIEKKIGLIEESLLEMKKYDHYEGTLAFSDLLGDYISTKNYLQRGNNRVKLKFLELQDLRFNNLLRNLLGCFILSLLVSFFITISRNKNLIFK